eukprot:CAMPEP_0174832602 /NCGR_PEP_ID=MMETSP1114-20130205/3762_1 /TAXON_ID=312471 /ORGANISM="Neobodo designis, Strain CCAP 1951/1" /LENGTH=377 /DNA_ID=CAMNT_0016066463 /DNA_START=919 /DNA_END=2052 /DNA_ORIENTATION=-
MADWRRLNEQRQQAVRNLERGWREELEGEEVGSTRPPLRGHMSAALQRKVKVTHSKMKLVASKCAPPNAVAGLAQTAGTSPKAMLRTLRDLCRLLLRALRARDRDLDAAPEHREAGEFVHGARGVLGALEVHEAELLRHAGHLIDDDAGAIDGSDALEDAGEVGARHLGREEVDDDLAGRHRRAGERHRLPRRRDEDGLHLRREDEHRLPLRVERLQRLLLLMHGGVLLMLLRRGQHDDLLRLLVRLLRQRCQLWLALMLRGRLLRRHVGAAGERRALLRHCPGRRPRTALLLLQLRKNLRIAALRRRERLALLSVGHLMLLQLMHRRERHKPFGCAWFHRRPVKEPRRRSRRGSSGMALVDLGHRRRSGEVGGGNQ